MYQWRRERERESVQGHSEQVSIGKSWECLGMTHNLPKQVSMTLLD